MFLILTLIIVVAAFNVISSLIMMVKDKAKDIAILRTMGAGSGAVMRIFLMCGASVGVLGTLVGFGLGVVFCAYIEPIRQLVQAITGTKVFDPRSIILNPYRQTRLASGNGGYNHVFCAVVTRDDLSKLARGAYRSDRDPA